MKLSAKYGNIHPPLVERIFSEEKAAKDPVKAVKTRLHQLYGAYVQANAHKKTELLLDLAEEQLGKNPPMDELKAVSSDILKLHASTKERHAFYEKFYAFIANNVGAVETIMDLGCGFNPFSLPIMPEGLTKNLQAYCAYDIDTRVMAIINRFFLLLGLPQNAFCVDLAAKTPALSVDITFMFKLLPVLESQMTGRGFGLVSEIKSRYFVVTYPLKSLGGREKGMGQNYSVAFGAWLREIVNIKLIASERIGNELIYILEGG